MDKNDQPMFKMELTKEQVEWVINRDKILDHIFFNRDQRWMPYIYPDEVYRSDMKSGSGYREAVWEEIKAQVKI